MGKSYEQSAQWQNRLNHTMPWGSSTSSKAPSPTKGEPGVVVRGQGCRVWDADDNEYIDFRFGLGPVTLGYRYPAVNDAIRKQLDESGILFGYPHPLEAEVSEMLCEVIPCAEQARFLKTGGEAIAAAIRIARTYTGRDRIIQIGYNGWVNSLGSGTTILPRQQLTDVPAGVPKAVSELHHISKWNDIASVEQWFDAYPGQIAAIVIAADYAGFEQGASFYPALRKLADQHGALLIYDEIVTGFRVAIGGVQQYFGVVPDLSVFSKGIANGMPISVYAGRKELMAAIDRGTGASVSSTFGGETLSLAATKACIQVYREQDVIGHMWRQSEKLWTTFQQHLTQYNVPLTVAGAWPCPMFVQKEGAPADTVSRLSQLAYEHGVALSHVPYTIFSHQDEDIREANERLEQACHAYQQSINH